MLDWPTFSLTALLDWLDEAAGGLIRLAYLAAGVTAVAVYFGAGQLPARMDHAFNAALPWALAFALETHTYLTARRVRAAWQERDRAGLQVNVGVLLVLLAFSAWNQLGYLSGVWQPPHGGPLALPIWLAYAVRALIVPAAFMAAAFLAPLAPPITAQIEGEARATLADVFKIARKQRRQMLREAQAAGRDMTGALVELVGDAETRRIISHAYNAIREPGVRQPLPTAAQEGQQATLSVKADASAILNGAPDDGSGGPDDSPGGGGLAPDVADGARTPSVSAPPQVVRIRAGRRPKPAAVRRRERAAAEALDERQRSAAWVMLDADSATSANKIAQQLHIGHRKARRLMQSWESRQTSRLA